MKIHFTTLLLSIGIVFQLIGQNIGITIEKEIFCNANKSLVFLSNDDGTILHDWHLNSSDFEENVVLNCFLEKGKYLRLDVTVYNEYSIDVEGEKHTIFDAFTEQNISEKHLIKKERACDYPKLTYEYRNIAINISGVEILNAIDLNSLRYDYRSTVKTKKGKTKIRYQLFTGSDLFITLFCNGETAPKTIYLKSDEIQPIIDLDWSTLNTDIKEVSIPILDTEYWNARLTATNEDTGMLSVLFGAKYQILESATSFFIPQNEFFYNFKLSLQKTDDDYENRRIYFESEGEDFAINKIEYPELKYESDISDDNSFKINLDNDIFDLSFKYMSSLCIVDPTSPYSSVVKHEISCLWRVKNNSQNDVNYSLPNLSPYLSNYSSIELLKKIHPISATFSHTVNSNQVVKVEDYFKKGFRGYGF